MRLIIAEKPSVARSIATALEGPRERFEGFARVGNDVVSHLFGHALELAPPENYNPKWAKWVLEDLPILIPYDGWKLIPKQDAKKQLFLIRDLLKKADKVIHAGDPDREGQLLVDEVLDYCGWKGPTDRLLLHDTTPAGVRKALAKLRPNSDFKALYRSGMCRAHADWLVGLNITRAASERIGLTTSVGRVQTPALALVVRRDLVIENHKEAIFYTLHAHVATQFESVLMAHATEHDRISDEKEAKRIANALTGAVVQIDVTERLVQEHSPLPHNLASYHKVAEALYGWGAKKAHDVLDAAYNQELVNYPRTDCRHLPEDQKNMAKPLANVIIGGGHFQLAAGLLNLMEPRSHVYDDSKVLDSSHTGLMPTTKMPGTSTAADVKKAWLIVSEQWIKSLLPTYQANVKEATFIFENRVFKAAGEQALNQDKSWRALEPKLTREKAPLQPLTLAAGDGEQLKGRVHDVDVKRGKTIPPKPYTESSLAEDMTEVHKFVEDPRIKAVLKGNAGLGTPATQKEVIETLKKRGYVSIDDRSRGKTRYLRSTRFGRYLIANLPPVLSDPGVTAAWEEQLNRIAEGGADPREFMRRIETYVVKNLERLRTADFPPPPEPPAAATAKKGAVRKAKKGSCSLTPVANLELGKAG